MRNTKFVMVAAVLLMSAGAGAQGNNAPPQQDVPKTTAVSTPDAVVIETTNQVEFGVRGTTFGANSDHARFQRYQDLRDGPTLDRFRYGKESNRYLMKLEADHVGYRDQRFFG